MSRKSTYIEFFWVTTLCSAVVEGGWSMDLQNFGILPKHYTDSQPRRPRHETSP